MLDGIGKAIGCLMLVALLIGAVAGACGVSCAKGCKYRVVKVAAAQPEEESRG